MAPRTPVALLRIAYAIRKGETEVRPFRDEAELGSIFADSADVGNVGNE